MWEWMEAVHEGGKSPDCMGRREKGVTVNGNYLMYSENEGLKSIRRERESFPGRHSLPVLIEKMSGNLSDKKRHSLFPFFFG